ncbi:MAG: nicotinate (nicotinamide) nucleotide adenylyltransferase [Mariprofundaceae bacterium]|nr:nicotinate (nicotinamide) nucleotide adenylyltransferase [Mariprofundaceae bacterium]
MTKIAVFGGSFDPPHVGHKALVQAALHNLDLDAVWVIPVGKPVHRTLTPRVSPQQRFLWVQKMFEDMPKVDVFDWEVCQENPTPTIDMMRWVNEQLDSVPIWLMGMDAWCGLPSWVAYPEHMQWCNVLVLDRQGEALKQHDGWCEVNLDDDSVLSAGHVAYMHVDLPNVSATKIRQAILTGQDVSTVLDARIMEEIQTAYRSRGDIHE